MVDRLSDCLFESINDQVSRPVHMQTVNAAGNDLRLPSADVILQANARMSGLVQLRAPWVLGGGEGEG